MGRWGFLQLRGLCPAITNTDEVAIRVAITIDVAKVLPIRLKSVLKVLPINVAKVLPQVLVFSFLLSISFKKEEVLGQFLRN